MSSFSDCGNLTVSNGQFTAISGTTFGQTATQSCDTGYTMSGVETVVCTESGWNASTAVCTIVGACILLFQISSFFTHSYLYIIKPV